MLKTDVVCNCSPEVLRLKIKKVVEIGDYFKESFGGIGGYFKRWIQDVLWKKGNEFGKIHVRLVHQQFGSDYVFLLLAELLFFVGLVFIFALVFAHQMLYIRKRFIFGD